jgi:hypothetical protein
MSDEPDRGDGDPAPRAEVPEGAAVFPLIPEELGVDPLLLAVLHAVVFLAGSDDEIVNPDAAEEARQYVADYLQRLKGPALQRVREDMLCLTTFARKEKWPRQLTQFLKNFLADHGVGEEGESEDEDG